jgi:hypothetical protein
LLFSLKLCRIKELTHNTFYIILNTKYMLDRQIIRNQNLIFFILFCSLVSIMIPAKILAEEPAGGCPGRQYAKITATVALEPYTDCLEIYSAPDCAPESPSILYITNNCSEEVVYNNEVIPINKKAGDVFEDQSISQEINGVWSREIYLASQPQNKILIFGKNLPSQEGGMVNTNAFKYCETTLGKDADITEMYRCENNYKLALIKGVDIKEIQKEAVKEESKETENENDLSTSIIVVAGFLLAAAVLLIIKKKIKN